MIRSYSETRYEVTAVTVESMLSVENAVDASLMVGEAGKTGG